VIDDATFKVVSLILQVMVIPGAGLLWFLIREVQNIRVMLYRDFATKAELASTKGEIRDHMQIVVSAIKANGSATHGERDWS
jgi:hypothetical protein